MDVLAGDEAHFEKAVRHPIRIEHPTLKALERRREVSFLSGGVRNTAGPRRPMSPENLGYRPNAVSESIGTGVA